ncbi:MAG: hypothetical protein M3Q07_10570 [Pseudobdellovibrionaceae bacterium]|nr:hypothetical protein [Pseudobdellovibrionaceae bacterium]
MQAQLFISSALLFFASAPSSMACGPESPDQVPGPQFSVHDQDDKIVLTYSDKTAHAIFDHLRDPQVRRFTSNFFQIKTGFGVLCVAQPGLQKYECFQEFQNDGAVQGFFPYAQALKDSAYWLKLNLKSPALEALYNKLSDKVNILVNDDGSVATIKQRTAITCTKLEQPDATLVFDCSQLLSGGGLPIGTGSDPMIGSGTHPVQLDVEEGANP